MSVIARYKRKLYEQEVALDARPVLSTRLPPHAVAGPQQRGARCAGDEMRCQWMHNAASAPFGQGGS